MDLALLIRTSGFAVVFAGMALWPGALRPWSGPDVARFAAAATVLAGCSARTTRIDTRVRECLAAAVPRAQGAAP